MGKITQEICSAFEAGRSIRKANSETDGTSLWLHGNKIAHRKNCELWITNAGWESNTTKERLNGINGVNIHQKNFQWYLNDKEWNGQWVRVNGKDWFDENPENIQGEDKNNMFKSIAMVAKMGEIIETDKTKQNDWKLRMIKAGLENKGLIMPEDWNTLSEDDKEKRLNGVINQLTK